MGILEVDIFFQRLQKKLSNTPMMTVFYGLKWCVENKIIAIYENRVFGLTLNCYAYKKLVPHPIIARFVNIYCGDFDVQITTTGGQKQKYLLLINPINFMIELYADDQGAANKARFEIFTFGATMKWLEAKQIVYIQSKNENLKIPIFHLEDKSKSDQVNHFEIELEDKASYKTISTITGN